MIDWYCSVGGKTEYIHFGREITFKATTKKTVQELEK